MMARIFGHIHVDPLADLSQQVASLAQYPRASIGHFAGRGALLGSTGGRAASTDGVLQLVADARLDDRQALAKSLGLNARTTDDAELILAAYQRWGRRTPERLYGDFAFAVWDERTRELFCARDVFGVVPFFVRHDRNGVAFGTHLDGIWRDGDRLSPDRIAAYLVGLDDSASDTAFEAIKRLPPGHSLCWRRGDVVLKRHTSVEPEPEHLDGPEYAAGIRDRFLGSVRDRSGGISNLGALLSGGLDSSSIVAAAVQAGGRPLRTFSFSYPKGSPFDESEFVSAMIERYAVLPEFVPMADLAPLDGLADLATASEDLVFGPGLLKVGRLFGRARRAGVGVILDGHGGDEVISHGFGRLKDLARQRRWRTLYRELRGVSRVSEDNATGLLLQYFANEGLIAKLRKYASRPAAGTSALPILDRDLAKAASIEARSEQWTRSYHEAAATEASLHLWNVTSPSVAGAFEALRRVADAAGVAVRFPFYDRRLVAYALAVPAAEKLKNGWTRHVMRAAMDGILPERVRWRPTKADFSAELAGGMARHHASLLSDMLRNSGPLAGIVDLRSARDRLDLLLANPRATPTSDVLLLWRMAFLAVWLNNRAKGRKSAVALS